MKKTCRGFRKKYFNTRTENEIWNFAEAKQKFGRRKLADVFNIGKTTTVTNILKNKKQLEQLYVATKKPDRPGKCNLINKLFLVLIKKSSI